MHVIQRHSKDRRILGVFRAQGMCLVPVNANVNAISTSKD